MPPGVLRILPVTPSLPLPPIPTGQLTAVPFPTFDCHSGLTAARYVVKMLVVPLLSDRCEMTTPTFGSFTPGLSFASWGSFHFLIVPRNSPAIDLSDRRRGLVRPGKL